MSFAINRTTDGWHVAPLRMSNLLDGVVAYLSWSVYSGIFVFACAFILNIPDPKIQLMIVSALFGVGAAWAVPRIFQSRASISEESEDSDRATSSSILKKSIASYAARPADWDGMSGTAPRPDAIADALSFIDDLPSSSPMPDDVFAPGDGEVMFQWHNSQSFIEVGFYGDDTISWFVQTSKVVAPSYGDDPFNRKSGRQIPAYLLNALQRLD
jgi:hypothetical protein